MSLFKNKEIELDKIIIKEGRGRKDFGDLTELKNSMDKSGLINPILITEDNILVAGERRLTAAKELKWKTIDVRITPEINPDNLILLEMMENVVRKDFTWAEELELKNALHNYWLKEAEEKNIKWGYRETAKKLGVSLGGLSTDLILASALKVFPELLTCDTKAKAKATYKKIGERAEAIQSMDKMSDEEKENINKLLKGKYSPQEHKKEIPVAIHEDSLPEYDQNKGVFKSEQPINQEENNYKVEAGYSIEPVSNFLKKFSSSSIGLIELDPPYAIDFNTNYGKVSKIKSKAIDWTKEQLFDFYNKNLSIMYDILLDSSWILCWTGKEYWLEINNLAKQVGFKIQPPGVWVKPSGSSNTPATNMISTYEMFLLFRKGNATFNISSFPSSIHFDPPPASQRIHQWEKPIEMYRYFFQALGKTNSLFLSLFAGSGNSLIAAQYEKMIPVGCDKSQQYIYSFYERFNNIFN